MKDGRFEIGDVVVLGKFKGSEFALDWHPGMDQFVGTETEVRGTYLNGKGLGVVSNDYLWSAAHCQLANAECAPQFSPMSDEQAEGRVLGRRLKAGDKVVLGRSTRRVWAADGEDYSHADVMDAYVGKVAAVRRQSDDVLFVEGNDYGWDAAACQNVTGRVLLKCDLCDALVLADRAEEQGWQYKGMGQDRCPTCLQAEGRVLGRREGMTFEGATMGATVERRIGSTIHHIAAESGDALRMDADGRLLAHCPECQQDFLFGMRADKQYPGLHALAVKWHHAATERDTGRAVEVGKAIWHVMLAGVMQSAIRLAGGDDISDAFAAAHRDLSAPESWWDVKQILERCRSVWSGRGAEIDYVAAEQSAREWQNHRRLREDYRREEGTIDGIPASAWRRMKHRPSGSCCEGDRVHFFGLEARRDEEHYWYLLALQRLDTAAQYFNLGNGDARAEALQRITEAVTRKADGETKSKIADGFKRGVVYPWRYECKPLYDDVALKVMRDELTKLGWRDAEKQAPVEDRSGERLQGWTGGPTVGVNGKLGCC